MPRAKSVADEVEKEEVVVEENTPEPYHIMVRYLSASGVDEPGKDRWSLTTVKDHLKVWVDLGYRVMNTGHIGSPKDEGGSKVVGEGFWFFLEYVG